MKHCTGRPDRLTPIGSPPAEILAGVWHEDHGEYELELLEGLLPFFFGVGFFFVVVGGGVVAGGGVGEGVDFFGGRRGGGGGAVGVDVLGGVG